ncbi:MAG TPA: hemolysin III family protein [Spirochaetota bacterium]|nr:hemolysin III family protein [Spirochaetota bacterium]
MSIRQPFSSISHFAGAVAALAGTVVLAVVARHDTGTLAAALVYGVSATLLFTASGVYHAARSGENGRSAFRKLDHSAIYAMIAGTYTPVAFAYLSRTWAWSIVAVQWGLVAAGIAITLLWITRPRGVTVAIYVAMGWVAIVAVKELLNAMPARALVLLLAGGLAYMAGAIIYAIKKPDPLPGRFGFHEVFHVFILLGAGFHYFLVFDAVGGS